MLERFCEKGSLYEMLYQVSGLTIDLHTLPYCGGF